ncbi:LexA family protein [Foetidibacter luteolus]|uniref:LexA family protein n=1 Tax=Foetidibacter luteolus TaxID=2608880 RepID=UPI001F30D43F|nr:translesion error-prone DNA polymerase V autoproteolytic subunit [Foetidibacter luteolus]
MDAAKMNTWAIPLLDIGVPAGFPSPAADYVENRINVNDFLIKHPESTFIIRCTGDSMINAFIPPQAYLIVDKSLTAKNGDIVLAVVNGEFTVKYLVKNDHKCWLRAANSKFKDLEITPEMNMSVWGVVTSIIANPNELRNVCFG